MLAAGLELRKIRNMRGLKPSHVARMGGHHGLARLLSDARPDRRRRLRGPQLTADALLAVLVQVQTHSTRSMREGLGWEAQPVDACMRALIGRHSHHLGPPHAHAWSAACVGWRPRRSLAASAGQHLMAWCAVCAACSAAHVPADSDLPAGRRCAHLVRQEPGAVSDRGARPASRWVRSARAHAAQRLVLVLPWFRVHGSSTPRILTCLVQSVLPGVSARGGVVAVTCSKSGPGPQILHAATRMISSM